MSNKEEPTLEQKVKECRKIKFCSHCKEEKEFYNKSIWCKTCSKEKSKIWYQKNKQRSKEASRKWALAHPEKVMAAKRKYREANKDKEREYGKKRRKENPDRENKRKLLWNSKNPDKNRAIAMRAITKLRSTPKGSLNHRISSSIRQTLRGTKNGKKWQELVGYTLDELKKSIEKQFLPNMSWDNMMDWHIDHKTPISVFNFTKPEDIDFHRCWALNNLQPMWSKDNISKSDKIEHPFQPALAMGF